jgi:anaerobic selenocysteine-containing dehydrogenase
LIVSPSGQMRARARLQPALHPRVIVGQHGWWQSCPELGLSEYPTADHGNANYNAAIDDAVSDPISGSVSHRAQLCEAKLL